MKFLLRRVVSALPWGAKEAVLQQLCEDMGAARLVARFAPGAGITGLQAWGDYGLIQSSSSDAEIFAAYAQGGKWADPLNTRLLDFFSQTRVGRYIDVGANIGLTTIPVARAYSGVRCLALEPEPTNFANLVVNVRANCPHSNVRCEQKAAFSARGALTFEIARHNLGDHRLRLGTTAAGKLGEDRRETIVVDAVELDEMSGPVEGPLAVKIDTQGAECFVVRGGRRTLARAQLLIVEFWPYGMRRMGSDPRDLIRFLCDTFDSAILVQGGRNMLPQPAEAIHTAALRLDRFADQNRDNPPAQLDVIAIQTPQRVGARLGW